MEPDVQFLQESTQNYFRRDLGQHLQTTIPQNERQTQAYRTWTHQIFATNQPPLTNDTTLINSWIQTNITTPLLHNNPTLPEMDLYRLWNETLFQYILTWNIFHLDPGGPRQQEPIQQNRNNPVRGFIDRVFFGQVQRPHTWTTNFTQRRRYPPRTRERTWRRHSYNKYKPSVIYSKYPER